MNRLHEACVAIFGVGCIGSCVAHLLVQNGIPALDLIDPSKIVLTRSGCYKTSGASDAMKFRTHAEMQNLRRINPAVAIREYNLPITEDYLGRLSSGEWDYIIDLLEDEKVTQLLLACADRNKISFISGLNMKNRLDASKIRITFADKVSEQFFPSEPYKIFANRRSEKVKLAYSEEIPEFSGHIPADPSCSDCACPPFVALTCPKRRQVNTPCSSFVSAMAGLLISREVLLDLADAKDSD